jgi:hypothetical protein
VPTSVYFTVPYKSVGNNDPEMRKIREIIESRNKYQRYIESGV